MTDERRVNGRHDGIENDKVKEKRDGKLLRRVLKHKVREELRGLRKARAAKFKSVAKPSRHGGPRMHETDFGGQSAEHGRMEFNKVELLLQDCDY